MTISFDPIWIPIIISIFPFLIAIFGDYSGYRGNWVDFGPIARLFYIAFGVIVWLIYFTIMYFVS